MSSNAGEPGRLRVLDSLRGVAILLVLAYHFAPQVPTERALGHAGASLLQIGWVGVDLFFVLSGFLITGILLDGERTPGAMLRFYGRRALRILPLYYAALAVLLLIAATMRATGAASGGFTGPGATLLAEQTWYWLHAANVAIARDAQWAGHSWVQHFWSLAVEEQFYLVWPCVVLLVPRRRLPHVIVGVVIAALLARVAFVASDHVVAAYVLMPARADALAIGALLAVLWRMPARHALVTRVATWLVPLSGAALLAIIVAGGADGHGVLMASLGYTQWALLFGAVLWLGVAGPPTWLERQRWLHWTARYSYGLYVVHFPLRHWLAGHGLAANDFVARYGDVAGTALGFAVGVLASLALAVPLWHLFERPVMERGGAWLDRRLARGRIVTEPATATPAPVPERRALAS